MRHALDCGLACGLTVCDCGVDRYRVLRPRYEKTGETTQTPDGLVRWERVIWDVIGTAQGMEDAKRRYAPGRKYGRALVLEAIK